MRLPVLFITAILTPILLCASLLLPAYSSLYGAAYIVYSPESGVNPMAGKFLDMFTVLDSYMTLFNYWMTNRDALDFVDYTLPIMVLPAFGILFSVWLTYVISRRLLNFFQLSASI